MKQVASSLATSFLYVMVAASACNSKSDQGAGGGPAQVLDYGMLTIQPQHGYFKPLVRSYAGSFGRYER